MRTRITELLGIEHPIVQGGMHVVEPLARGLQVLQCFASGQAHLGQQALD